MNIKILPLFASLLSSLFSSCNIGEDDPAATCYPKNKITSICRKVDLGLPSGLKWATCNVGATSETENGYFFKWGETSQYVKNTYKWMDKDSLLTKYCIDKTWGSVDNISVLEPEDDAAHILMGDGWRMPTKEDFEELITECTFKWTDNHKGTNVPGIIFTSNNNGNTLFFPACGYYEKGIFKFGERRSLIWSSSLVDGVNAWVLRIDEEEPKIWSDADFNNLTECGRCMGLSVRGVYK